MGWEPELSLSGHTPLHLPQFLKKCPTAPCPGEGWGLSAWIWEVAKAASTRFRSRTSSQKGPPSACFCFLCCGDAHPTLAMTGNIEKTKWDPNLFPWHCFFFFFWFYSDMCTQLHVLFYTYLCLFWAALDLHRCTRAFSSCREWRLLSRCTVSHSGASLVGVHSL